MAIAYENHPKYKNSILVRKLIGNVSPSELIESWKYLIDYKLISSSTKGIINDLTNCNLCMNRDEFDSFIQFLDSNKTIRKIKIAVITTNPKNIVFPMLAENSKNQLNVKPFSTSEAAENWIMNYSY